MRLIDADKLDFSFDRKALSEYESGWTDGADAAIAVVKNAPTIDAEPVKHGQWEYDPEYDEYNCTFCNDYSAYEDERTHYCPNCGAKMDLEEKKHGMD